jgi:hypothetical protein
MSRWCATTEDPKVKLNNLPLLDDNHLKQVCKPVCTFHGRLPKGSQWSTSHVGNAQILRPSLCAQLNHGEAGGCWEGLVSFFLHTVYIGCSSLHPPSLFHLIALFKSFHIICYCSDKAPKLTTLGIGHGNVAVRSVAVFIGYWWPLPYLRSTGRDSDALGQVRMTLWHPPPSCGYLFMGGLVLGGLVLQFSVYHL